MELFTLYSIQRSLKSKENNWFVIQKWKFAIWLISVEIWLVTLESLDKKASWKSTIGKFVKLSH